VDYRLEIVGLLYYEVLNFENMKVMRLKSGPRGTEIEYLA
jgi:hypothetical protein